MTIACNLSKFVRLVLNPFVGSFSTTKVFRLLENHRIFVGCGKEVSCLQKSMQCFLEGNASPLLYDRSDLTDDHDLKDSAHVYLTAVKKGKIEGIVLWTGRTTCSTIFKNVSGACAVIPVRSALG